LAKGSQDEIRDVVAYARTLHIAIVPEIECRVNRMPEQREEKGNDPRPSSVVAENGALIINGLRHAAEVLALHSHISTCLPWPH